MCSKLLNKFPNVANVSADASHLSPLSLQLSMATNLVKEMVDDKSLITNHDRHTKTATEKTIQPRPCLPLNPRLCNALNDEVSCVLNMDSKPKNVERTMKLIAMCG